MTIEASGGGLLPPRQFKVTRYNQRMAQRITNRAKLNENGVAVAFTFNNLFTMLMFGLMQDIAQYTPIIGPYIDMAVSLVSFWFHRIILVTDDYVYIYRDLPFHYPSHRLATYERGAGVVTLGSPNPGSVISRFIRRGQLNFHDGEIVYHSIIWIRRAQYIEQEGNRPAGQ